MKPAIKIASYAMAKWFFSLLLYPYFRLDLRGAANIPKRGGVMVAANHFSYADPLILGVALPRRLRFIMAQDQFKKPLVNAFSRLMDVIPVSREGQTDLGPIKRALKLLRQGNAVAIFPEGRRSRKGVLLPPQGGLGFLAQKAGVPIVPVAIIGTREAYPAGQKLPRPGKVSVVVGEPIHFPAGVSSEGVAQATMDAIAALFREVGRHDYLGEEASGGATDFTAPPVQ